MSASEPDNLEEIARNTQRKARAKASSHTRNGTRGAAFGRLLVLSVDDIDTAEPRDYLLKGLLSPGEVSIWVGPPKCGKSFLLLYLAYMLSLGLSVFGRRVKPTKVLYVAAEGEAGIANRVRALRNKYGPSENFHFIAQPADLLRHDGDKSALIAAANAYGAQLIVLDTLSRLLAGGDENSPQDMGTFVRNVGEVRHETGAHVAIVHHGTKASNGSNPRGHSSLTGADDALIEVLKLDDGSRQAIVIHAKDDPDGMRWAFKLEPVELDIDGDGDPITTLLTVETDAPLAPTGTKTSDNDQIGLNTLQSAINAHALTANVGEDNAQVTAVYETHWRACFYREGRPGETQDTKKHAFNRTVKSLLAKGRIGTRDELVWVTK